MPNQSSPQEPAFRILVVVSRPLDQKELPTIADQWALANGLATVKTPAFLHILRPPTIERLRNEILNGYNIIHFDGHGSFALRCPNCISLCAEGSRKCGNCDASLEAEMPRGYLAFEQEDGKQDALAADELAEMLQTVPGSPTKLVFLSACESAKGEDQSLAATLLQGGIPAVLGMKESVLVETTVALSRALYAALGAGMTIEGAFKNSLPALSRLPDSRETGTKARDIPTLQGPGVGKRMIVAPVRGSLILEKERLFGVPEFDFVGEYIPGHPPRGRKGLLSQATDALLQGEKLVVLTGQGGIGKSVLAAAAARRISWRYPGGVFWRSAADIERLDLNKLLDAFDNVFGDKFRTLPLDAKQTKVLGYLQDLLTPSLIVIDNAEIVKDPAIWRFLEGLPQLSAALVTTREVPRRDGTQIRVQKMEPLETFKLFITEARRRSPWWGKELDQAEMKALEEINQLLDGHPLGIKLAAGLLAGNSLESIRQKLRTSPPGEEISNRFDFSYNTLTQSQQKMLHRLAAFASSYADWAPEAISELKPFEEYAAESLTNWREDHGDLVRKSFIDMVAIGRYRMHPLMRQYSAIKMGQIEMKAHKDRASILFLMYAERFKDDVEKLKDEHENILEGISWACQAEIKGEGNEAKEYPEARKAVMGYARALLAKKGGNPGYLIIRGYWIEAKQLATYALDAARSTGDKSNAAFAYKVLGIIAQNTGDYREAERCYLKCLKIENELKNENGVAIALNQLGVLGDLTNSPRKARRCFEKSIKIKTKLNDKLGKAHTLGNLANLYKKGKELPKVEGIVPRNIENISGIR